MRFYSSASYIDFPINQTFHQFHDLDNELDVHRITSGYDGAFVTGVACQLGKLSRPDTLFPTLFGICPCLHC